MDETFSLSEPDALALRLDFVEGFYKFNNPRQNKYYNPDVVNTSGIYFKA